MSVTIKDIARLAGVSIATVSKVVNNKDFDISEGTRARVQKIIDEENYRPNSLARSMITKTTKTVGLIIPDVRNPFFTDLARGAEDSAKENGYSLLFCNSDDVLGKEIEYINTLVEKQVDGIVLAGSINRNKALEENFSVNVPIVSLDRKVYFKGIKATVEIDNITGAHDAIEYLIQSGHKDILFLSGQEEVDISKDRLEGYKKALKENHIPFNPDYVIFGLYKSEFGYQYIMENELPTKVTAIFCGNDLIALGAIKALKSKKIKVPNDISIMGFDDISLASINTPELTTVKQPSYEFGYIAVQRLIDIIEGITNRKDKFEIKTELIIRESTAMRRNDTKCDYEVVE